MGAIQQLPVDEVIAIQSKSLFSKQEEDLLGTIPIVRFLCSLYHVL